MFYNYVYDAKNELANIENFLQNQLLRKPAYYFLKALLRYNSQSIKFAHLKCTAQWVLVCLQSCAAVTTI